MLPAWDRDALLAQPQYESLWPTLSLCPAGRFPAPEDLNELARSRGIASGSGAPIRFMSYTVPPEPGLPYELRIFRDGDVPTRPDNYHDLFNALVWLAFPKTKATLNRRHCEEMTARAGESSRGVARGGKGSRGVPRDVLTLFDESGIIVACSEPELARLMREFEWKALFWTRREEAMRAMRFLVFGHAIHEKALRPYKGVTARALIVPVAAEFSNLALEERLVHVDACAAAHFAAPDALASTHMLAPVPILGVPGWEPANECAWYYDDASVFRPGRAQRATKRSPPVRGAE